MAGDIGRIPGHDISHNLIDGIITLFSQCLVHRGQYDLHARFRLCLHFKKLCVSQILILHHIISSHCPTAGTAVRNAPDSYHKSLFPLHNTSFSIILLYLNGKFNLADS